MVFPCVCHTGSEATPLPISDSSLVNVDFAISCFLTGTVISHSADIPSTVSCTKIFLFTQILRSSWSCSDLTPLIRDMLGYLF